MEQCKEELARLEDKTRSTNFWDNPDQAKSIIERVNTLRRILQPFWETEKKLEEQMEWLNLVKHEEESHQHYDLMQGIKGDLEGIEREIDQLEIRSLLNDPLDFV